MRLENDGSRKRGKLSDAIRSLISWTCDSFCSRDKRQWGLPLFSLQSWFKLLRFFVRLSVHTDGLESDIEMSNTVISLGPSYVHGIWLRVGWEYLLSWTCGKTALATCRSLTWRWWEWISGWEYVILHRSDQSTVIFSTWWDISTSQWGPRLASSCARNSSAWFIPTAAKFLD